MALARIPNEVLEVIRQHEVIQPPLIKGESVNFGLCRISNDQDADDLFHGNLLNLRHKDMAFVLQTNTTGFSHLKLEGTPVILRVDPELGNMLVQAAEVYVHRATIQQLQPLTICLNSKTLIVPLWDEFRQEQSPEPWIIEIFAGGFGGWQYALRFLRAHSISRRPTLAIESELPFATQFALTHGFNLVGCTQDLPSNFLRDLNEDVIFHSKVQDIEWQKQLQMLFPELWFISAPCRTWTHASSHEGLYREDGLVMIESIAQARIFRPKLIGFEQVKGFQDHPQFAVVERILEWAGYIPLFKDVLDLADLTPVRRQRFLALYIRSEDRTICQPQPWPERSSKPSTFDAGFEIPSSELVQFQPTAKQAALYFDATLIPGPLKAHTTAEILARRLPSLDGKLPTFMAAYGEQHNIAPYRLNSHGLFGHFRRQALTFRFWTPYEIVLLHGQFHACVLLKPSKLAYQTIGNCIAVLHALYVIYHAFCVLSDFSEKTRFDDMVAEFLNHRLKASEIDILQDECAWYVGHPIETPLLQSRLQFFMAQMSWTVETTNYWPEFSFFSPTRGLCDYRKHMTPGIDTDPAVSLTLPIQMFFDVMLYLIPGEYGVLKVDSNTSWRTLLSLWDYQVQPVDFHFDWSQIDMRLVDTSPQLKTLLATNDTLQDTFKDVRSLGNTLSRLPLLVRNEIDLTLYEIEKGTTWKHFRQLHQQPNIQYHDCYGPICDATWFSQPMEIGSQSFKMCPNPEFLEDLRLLTHISIETIVPCKTDILVFHCQGTTESCYAFQRFWLSKDLQHWLHSVGRQANLQIISDTTWRLLLRPKLPSTAMPVAMLRDAMFVRLLQKGFRSLQTTSGTDCLIKFQGKAVARGHYPASMSLLPFWQLLKHVYAIHLPHRQPSLLSSGKLCTEACNIQDLSERKLSPGTVVLYISFPVLGGGPTAKQEFAKAVEAGVAKLFLEYGLNLPQVATSTTKLIDCAGMQRLHHLVHGEASRRHESFEQLCEAAKIPLPPPGERTKTSQVQAKFKKLRDKQSSKQLLTINPDDYQLREGFFRNQDGSNAPILQQFSLHSTGVILMTAALANEWLLATQDLAPDELGLYVIGPLNIPPRFKHVQVNAPASDKYGQEVLLNGTLIQMGAIPLTTAAADAKHIEVRDVQVASMTLWRDDWEDHLWQAVQKSPVKTIKNLLALDGHDELMGKPWGRTFQRDGLQVQNTEDAVSFQCHAEFENGKRFRSLLKRSGFNKIYITPKDNAGKPHTDWKVIWMEASPLQLEAKSNNVAGVAGLIRGRKNYGIRVEAGSFKTAWEKLRPGQELPDLTVTKMVFRLQPLPQGLDTQTLAAWGTQSGCPIKPLKAVGAKQWIVGSNDAPPNLLQFNGQPILVQQLYQKGLQTQAAIAAGPRKAPQKPYTVQQQPASHATDIFHTGDPHMDPWTPASLRTSAAESKTTEPRSVAGPVTALFQQQDSRIQAMETMLKGMQDNQQQVVAQTEARFLQVENTIQQNAALTQTNFDSVRHEQQQLNQSLAHAMQQQEERLANSFDELKQLLLRQSCKRKTEDADPME